MKFLPSIMGNNPSVNGRPTQATLNIPMSGLPRLSDNNNYCYWRILLLAYLDTLGLWSGKAPVDVSEIV